MFLPAPPTTTPAQVSNEVVTTLFDFPQGIIDIQDIPPIRIQPFRITICTELLVPLLPPLGIPFPLFDEQFFQVLPALFTPWLVKVIENIIVNGSIQVGIGKN